MPQFHSLVPIQTLNTEQTVKWYESVLGFHRGSYRGNHWCRLGREGISIMFMTNAHLGRHRLLELASLHSPLQLPRFRRIWRSRHRPRRRFQ